ncbi:hypothetical protein FRC08_014035 [Ceratobasidium sp. 394]|nr:hypothetical protein FRC08_014035 [Ceratobasidium sp. 394]
MEVGVVEAEAEGAEEGAVPVETTAPNLIMDQTPIQMVTRTGEEVVGVDVEAPRVGLGGPLLRQFRGAEGVPKHLLPRAMQLRHLRVEQVPLNRRRMAHAMG